MDWIDELESKIKRKNQILFSKQSPLLEDIRMLLEQQNHRTVVLWALEFAQNIADELLLKYPDERSASDAVNASMLWASGIIKMPEAKQKILACHGAAKTISSLEDIALFHAVGQACSTVHTTGHAMGLPMYELTSLVRKYGLESCREPILSRKNEYIDRLIYWSSHFDDSSYKWAKFMLK